MLADQEGARAQLVLHRVERRIAALHPGREPLLEALGRARVGDPEARDGDVRLMAVLLEELPLQDLRALVGIGRHVLRPVAEVPEDRVRLGERPAVVEHERRHAKTRVQRAEHLRAIRAVDDRELHRLVLDPELRQKQAHLVTVARDRRVVQEHVDSVVGCDYAPEVAGARIRRLTDEELVSMLELARKSDSVELKLTVPAADHRAAITGLGLDPLEAQIRQVFFFDTPDLDLNAMGVVARARRIQGRAGDTVVKLRPVDPDGLPAELRLSPSVVVEVDAMPGGYVCSATLKAKANAPSVRDAALGKRAIKKLFSKEQRAFFSAHAPEGLSLDDLSILGPIFVLKQNFQPKEFPRRMVAELWFYPDGSRILELSTKCSASDAFQVAAESRLYLTEKGVSLDGKQETKTKAALTYFSKQLRAAASTA